MAALMRTRIKPPTIARLSIMIIVIATVAVLYANGIQRRLSWENVRDGLAPMRSRVQSHPVASVALFVAVYTSVTALSLPVATGMTLASGALFGRVVGTFAASLGSTLGATLAMLASRYVLAESVRNRFGVRLKAIDEGVARDGPFYLFLLRLVPAFPFVLINLGMGLTRMKVLPFAITSALGMLPATILYVNAGAELARVESPGQILSLRVLVSFALFGVAPLLIRKVVAHWRPSDPDSR